MGRAHSPHFHVDTFLDHDMAALVEIDRRHGVCTGTKRQNASRVLDVVLPAKQRIARQCKAGARGGVMGL
jgi:hypothetical protein